jgi:hypothetical protein
VIRRACRVPRPESTPCPHSRELSRLRLRALRERPQLAVDEGSF